MDLSPNERENKIELVLQQVHKFCSDQQRARRDDSVPLYFISRMFGKRYSKLSDVWLVQRLERDPRFSVFCSSKGSYFVRALDPDSASLEALNLRLVRGEVDPETYHSERQRLDPQYEIPKD